MRYLNAFVLLMALVPILNYSAQSQHFPLTGSPWYNESEWYKPEYAKLEVDTVKINYITPKGDKYFEKKAFNSDGYLIYYEEYYFSYYDTENDKPEILNQIEFEYDKKFRLVKILFNKAKIISHIGSGHYKRNGGWLPNEYSSYFTGGPEVIYPLFIKSLALRYNSDNFGSQPDKILFRGFIRKQKISEVHVLPLIPNNNKPDPLGIFKQEYFDLEFELGDNIFEKVNRYINCKNYNLSDYKLWMQPIEANFCLGSTVKQTINLENAIRYFYEKYPHNGEILLQGKSIRYEVLNNTGQLQFSGSEFLPENDFWGWSRRRIEYNYFKEGNLKGKVQSIRHFELNKPSKLPEMVFPLPNGHISSEKNKNQSSAGSISLSNIQEVSFYYNPNGLLEYKEQTECYNCPQIPECFDCIIDLKKTIIFNYSYTFRNKK